VRELENIVERALVIGRSKEISADDLPFSRKGAGLETFPKSLKMMEKVHIERILEAAGWNMSQAARDLDIDRQTLYNKLEKYEIRREDS
jgi:DNA-binding NtrC family response regulator